MPKLAEDVKAFIVERLACFARPTEVVDAVKERFGIVIPRQQVEEYDPEKRCTTKKWVALHAATRKAYVEKRAGLAITHRSWRLEQLEEVVRAALKKKNPKIAMEALEQAAKEDGDYYVNARANAPASSETEEQRVEKMRQQFDAMDAVTLGTHPSPPTKPTLHVSAA